MMLGASLEKPEPALKVEVIRDAIGFQGLRVAWGKLWRASCTNPFLTWNWMQAHWARLAPRRRLMILAARTAGGALVGILPLSIERQGLARVCRFLADETVGSDYLDALVSRELALPARRALWKCALRFAEGAYDILELREMLRDGQSVLVLRELLRREGSEPEIEPNFRCPYIALDTSYADLLHALPRAENLRRRQKQLARTAGFAIDVAQTEPALAAGLEIFFRLHKLRWHKEGGSQGIPSPRIEGFHREVIHRFAESGEARLYTLRIGAQPLASVYMLGAGAVRYFYQSGYDPAFAKLSPGLVLLARTVEDTFSEGAREYDFLHGSEPYKFEWATGERQTVTLRHTVLNLRGTWRAAERKAALSARALGQTLLGERYELLRRLRRRFAFA